MSKMQKKSMSEPDDERNFDLGHVETVSLAGELAR